MNNICESSSTDYSLSEGQKTILDIFRITAALFVLFGHGFSFFQCTIFKDQSYFPYIQNIGVVLLFLISGFLTTYSLEKNNNNHNYTFSKFFSHKASRIYREYIPGLVIISIVDFISININGDRYMYYNAYNIRQFFSNLFMLQNMGPYGILGHYCIPFGSARPLWTLSIEWWIHMLFGSMFLVLKNKERITIINSIIIGISILMCAEYIITGRGAGLGFVFAIGVLSFYLYKLIDQRLAWRCLFLSIILYIAYGLLYKEAYTVYSFLILGLLFCSTLKVADVFGNKRSTFLAFISKSTFMLYLVHYSIFDLLVNSDIIVNNNEKFLIGIICSSIISLFVCWVFRENRFYSFHKIQMKNSRK